MPGDGSVTPAGSCGSEAELASPGGGVRPPGVRPREPENCELGVGGGRELILSRRGVLLSIYYMSLRASRECVWVSIYSTLKRRQVLTTAPVSL